MTTLATVLLSVLGAVCLGIPLTSVAVVYRDELPPVWDRVRRALAFDPRHPGLHPYAGR
ncbi:hypothetical protein SAMN04488544_1086 [Microlunatus sagamiharensis]|uniref:Uncharacterized protein n=1 Tax=Microlunatus sagamiharensis TaxID=546874 RepID=A0A1H2LZD3_9ACTN|nr:hypothetical protein [Microlunatus sagamiharensis]SDU85981.1 hypothetical protein SAMN04488544_1086 [Microlunatus sagamiharensis]